MRTISPGSTSRTYCALSKSNAHVSEATTQVAVDASQIQRTKPARIAHRIQSHRASAAAANTRLPPGSAHRPSRRKDCAPRCARSDARSLPCRWWSEKSSRDAPACGRTSPAFVRLPLWPSATLPLLQSITIGCAFSSDVVARGRIARVPDRRGARQCRQHLRRENFLHLAQRACAGADRCHRSKQFRPIPARDAAARTSRDTSASPLRHGRRRRTHHSDRGNDRRRSASLLHDSCDCSSSCAFQRIRPKTSRKCSRRRPRLSQRAIIFDAEMSLRVTVPIRSAAPSHHIVPQSR